MKSLLSLALLGLMISLTSCGGGDRLKKAEAKVQSLEDAIRKQKASLLELSKTLGRVAQAEHDFTQRVFPAYVEVPTSVQTSVLCQLMAKANFTRANAACEAAIAAEPLEDEEGIEGDIGDIISLLNCLREALEAYEAALQRC